ncbi:uncharacterized protein BDW43DRAFT_263177 [Aspergillus alliaceus]|uniref:uncharacterized protein n=1 Tax=Petromyces alliaceus TaxID=209559 RepID=UPI0012A43F6A|nr:uncharacterized protein BDW43DRAFT_263177 [Aspergillus alliaceus]KAB8238181.1 hypothetical protein BDW43DRAFT_263177 [Aspergillus alliaceus]
MQVMLGGFLLSTQFVDAKSTSHLETAKVETMIAAGKSFASPKLNFDINHANADLTEQENRSGAAY